MGPLNTFRQLSNVMWEPSGAELTENTLIILLETNQNFALHVRYVWSKPACAAQINRIVKFEF